MPLDPSALLALWDVANIPACDVGLELAKAFLESCGEGVNRLGIEEPGDRIREMNAAYMALVEHSADCPDCNEASPKEGPHR
jgi:hypothetical protein